MHKPWFDPKTGILMFDQYVAKMPSFKKVMADDVITNEEFLAQAQKVAGLLKHLEGMLTPEAHTVCTAALCELSVLNALMNQRNRSGA
jgi:hypothetical protein